MNNGNFIYKDIELVYNTDHIDYYVILNYHNEVDYNKNNIVLQMEPWVYDNKKQWGIKQWKEWSIPDYRKFLYVRRHVNSLNPAQWFFIPPVLLSKDEENNKRHSKNQDKMIVILSDKYSDSGHINRVDFVKFVENSNLDIIDVYGYKNYHNFKNYKGTIPDKSIISQYKYMLSAENNNEKNYATEKIWESFMAGTLCFYDGCPNLQDYIDIKSFIKVDLTDKNNSLKIILNSIKNNEWYNRYNIILNTKKIIIEKYNALEIINDIIVKHMQIYQ